MRRSAGAGRLMRAGWARAALLAGLVGAAGGCRGGCDGPPKAPAAADATAQIAPDAAPTAAQTMGPDEVDRALKDGLRAVVARDHTKAIELFEAAAAADPGRREPHQRLCSLYRSAERWADARGACRAWRELETKPEFRARIDEVLAEMEGR